MHQGYTDANGRWTARPIIFPEARTFRDLFSAARFASGMPEIDSEDATCWRYVTGTRAQIAAPHWDKTSRRYIKTRGGKFWCHGIGPARFMSCWARPLPGVLSAAESHLIGSAGSLEVIQRADGVLVTVRDSHSIGSAWLGLLDNGESLLSLMSTEDHAEFEAARLWEAQARSCVNGEEVDREKAAQFGIAVIESR